jgi:hypothetical protein
MLLPKDCWQQGASRAIGHGGVRVAAWCGSHEQRQGRARTGAPAMGSSGHVLGPVIVVTSCFGRCMGRSLWIFSIPNESQGYVL